eukprot:jgi/Botrbrau1/5408/Bobra.182_1s0012.1
MMKEKDVPKQKSIVKKQQEIWVKVRHLSGAGVMLYSHVNIVACILPECVCLRIC